MDSGVLDHPLGMIRGEIASSMAKLITYIIKMGITVDPHRTKFAQADQNRHVTAAEGQPKLIKTSSAEQNSKKG